MIRKIKRKLGRSSPLSLLLILMGTIIFAASLNNNTQKTETISSVGGQVQSTNNKLVFVAGQSSPTDVSVSQHYMEIGGFLGFLREKNITPIPDHLLCSKPVASLVYDCSTVPEAAGWLVSDPYTSNSTWSSDGERLIVEMNQPSGQASFYKPEGSLATAEMFAIEATFYVASYKPPPWFVPPFIGFGFRDGVKSTVVYPYTDLRKGQIAINYTLDAYCSEEGVTDWLSANTYRIVVDKSHADPEKHVVEVYLNDKLVLTVPYSAITDTPGGLPVAPEEPYLFGFGGNQCNMVWDNIAYEVCGTGFIPENLPKKSAQDSAVSVLPEHFNLGQNHPNPFNPSTTISYTVAKNSHVNLTVYNALGQVVAVLVNGFQQQGSYSVAWDAGNQPSGLYICRFEADGFTATKKMFLQK